MTRSELLDLAALCACGQKGIRNTVATVLEAYRLARHGKKGNRQGFHFRGLDFECLDPQHFAFLFTEIFVAEPYRFTSDKGTPYIIDGGVNIGLSVAYFKSLFPKSKVVGFEPHPEAHRVAQANFNRNRFQDVELHQAALSAKVGSLQLNFIPGESMASTVTNRLEVRGSKSESVTVPSVTLSPLLEREVDFLKLDIEGAEQGVLVESEKRLRQVKNMFIEFHITRADAANSLPLCLQVLERQGFDYLITSTLSSRKTAAIAPLRTCGPVSSISIFAKRLA